MSPEQHTVSSGAGNRPHAHATGTALKVALLLTLGYAAVEALAGWWSGSLALLSDAGHMVSDSVSLALAAFATWAAGRPASTRHSYGFGRAEIVAAFVNAALMLAVLVAITVSAVQRLMAPQSANGEAVVAVALIGLLLNAGVALILARGEKTINTRGALLHVVGDLLGSIAALVSGAVRFELSGLTALMRSFAASTQTSSRA
ncbi:MAG: cation diffusion facilitator family transporter [Burkholderiales bacterium]